MGKEGPRTRCPGPGPVGPGPEPSKLSTANLRPRCACDVAALDVPHAVFIGTSMGGLITMTLAALRPRAIAGAILNDVGP